MNIMLPTTYILILFSLFQNHCTLRIEPQYNLDELPPMDEAMLDYFRMYIEDLRHAEYEIPEQVSEVRHTSWDRSMLYLWSL